MTAPISFIAPLSIAAGMITSSTAVSKLPAEQEWSATATYTVGTVVFRTEVGRRFENQIPGVNANKPEDDQDRWYDLGATDKTAMFDSEVSTQSIAPGTLTAVFQPGPFNAANFLKIDGTSMTFLVKAAPGGAEVFKDVVPLEGSAPSDYFEHFFEPFKPKTEYLVTGLEPYASCEVTISISNPGGAGRCGMASLGDLVSVGGPALRGVTVEPKSYARVVTDDRGNTSIKKGKAARDLSASALVPIDSADDVVDALTSVMGVPCAWILTDSKQRRSLRGFGLGRGKLTYDKTNYATLDLTVEGMI
jgi:hypothetical protein